MMPFGALHADSHRLLSEDVPARLSGNLKLARELLGGMREEKYTNEQGEADHRHVLPFDGEKLILLFEYITRGLIHWHWGHGLSPGYVTRAMVMREEGRYHWDRMRSHRNATGLFGWSLGKDALRYEAFFDATNPNVTAWQFRMYGGAMMSDHSEGTSMIIGQSVSESALRAAGYR